MKYSVEQKVLQELLNYLAGRPYSEVHGLVTSLQKSAEPIQETQASVVSEDQASS